MQAQWNCIQNPQPERISEQCQNQNPLRKVISDFWIYRDTITNLRESIKIRFTSYAAANDLKSKLFQDIFKIEIQQRPQFTDLIAVFYPVFNWLRFWQTIHQIQNLDECLYEVIKQAERAHIAARKNLYAASKH